MSYALNTVFMLLAVCAFACSCCALPSRDEQLKDLQTRQILVYMWGWSAEEMAPAAKKFGFQVVNAPHGNDIKGKAHETAIWSKYGFKMIARPFVPVKDPFDPEDIRRGCEELNKTITYYDKNPDIIGFSLAWGLYGEGGFPYDFVFSDKAKTAFNEYMGTPGEPLPEPPAPGKPGSLRWVKWMEFRSKTLRDFRKTYVESAKKATDKLVGTWSEFYPIENYQLNMGEAPGADFLLYDLSFGDVTTDQTIAFAECHGDMQHYKTYQEWLNHELPLMAKAAGEGVIPMGFQFPMRRGHATDFLSKTTVFIDKVEDEYSIKSGPEIRKLIDAAKDGVRKPDVALVYQSFAGGALPGEAEFWFYQPSARFIEGMLHQMGVGLKVIPYEHLETADLGQYKIVIVPDPMYLSEAMRANLKKAKKVLYSGEYLLAHRDPATEKGDYSCGFSAITRLPAGELQYSMVPAGSLKTNTNAALMKGLPGELPYPADQTAIFQPMPKDAEVFVRAGDLPVVFSCDSGREVFVTNRFFNHAYHAQDDSLEKAAFAFLKNLMNDCGAKVRITDQALARVKDGFPYGSYGITGCVAWNKTERSLNLHLSDGQIIYVPAFGWAKASL